MQIIYMSIIGSIIYLILSIFKPITKKYFNSSWHYYMLLVILISFIIPYSNIIKIEGIEILNFKDNEIFKDIEVNENNKVVNNTLEKQENIKNTTTNSKNKEYNNIENNKDETNKKYKEIQKEKQSSSNKGLIKNIWRFGLIVTLIANFIVYLKFRNQIYSYQNTIKDSDINNIFDMCKETLKINKHIRLIETMDIDSPMLVGLINPTIIIPTIKIDRDRLEMIFLHELNHYKRNDILVKFIALIIRSIHWFNPFIYLIIRDLDKYCEYSIDEKVVVNMTINKRKSYADTILSLIDNSINRKTRLTTSMSNSGLELKNRLENMIYSTKMQPKKKYISIFVGILILISGLFIGCSFTNEKNNSNDSLAVYIKEDGLYYSYINDGLEYKIDSGDKFEYPLISTEGNYIAYTKDNSLYIYDLEREEINKIDNKIVSYYNAYDWISDSTIAYGSTERPGIFVYDIEQNKTNKHIDEYYYTGLKYSKSDKLYARRDYNTDFNQEYKNGIVEFNLKKYSQNKKYIDNKLIIEDENTIESKIGTRPIVWDISIDGRYIYVMEKFASGSLSSDIIGMGIYDSKDKSYKKLENLETLPYKNSLAISKNKDIFGIVEGAGRDMIYNKNIALVRIDKDKSYSISKINNDNLACQTPTFNYAGDKIFYSATKEANPNEIDDYNKQYVQWNQQPHNIYEYDLETQENRLITNGSDYDLLPIDLLNGEILFLRLKKNDKYSLIKLSKNEEIIIAEDISFIGGPDNSDFGFYGHINTEKGIDLFINNTKSNRNRKKEVKSGDIDKLFDNRNTLLGDNSKVVGIINNLKFPEELEVNGIELFTGNKPLGLQINLKTDSQVFAEYISSSSDYIFRKNSLILFSLINNLDYIQYSIKDENSSNIVGFMNRVVANDISKNISNESIESVAKDKRTFINFYNGLTKIEPNEFLTGNIVINGNNLLIKEVEVVELDNKKRVEELKLDESEFPNGYTIISNNKDILQLKLTENTIYNFTDIEGYFIENLESNRLYSTTNLSEFLKHLDEYKLNDIPLEKQTIPYFIEIKDGEVISITERFKYTI